MRVLVGLSGGVDSSVAAALLLEGGHDVVAVTLKLWGGAQDSGCCSVGDVDDARRAAQQLGIDHHVFNFSEDFDRDVVQPYVEAHERGRTPNPCVECNRHLKFGRLLARADQLGFDALATGHHARVVGEPGARRLRRGRDRAKDQSYVLHMLGVAQLDKILLPVGDLTKPEVRRRAAALGLRTADKPESQDTCFITASGGREAFLGARIPLRRGRVVDQSGETVGAVGAVQLITVGQRRGLGGGGGAPRYATAVDVEQATVTVGPAAALLVSSIGVTASSWTAGPGLARGTRVFAQTSAHGVPFRATWDGTASLALDQPQRRPAAGQSVVLYDGVEADEVLGGGAAI